VLQINRFPVRAVFTNILSSNLFFFIKTPRFHFLNSIFANVWPVAFTIYDFTNQPDIVQDISFSAGVLSLSCCPASSVVKLLRS